MKRDEYKMTQQVDTTDYKQKYEQALERAKKGECIENIFQELRESEDEQHRKWILEYLYDGLRKSDEQFKGQFKSAIAWLEKQGEQKSWRKEDEKYIAHIIAILEGWDREHLSSISSVVPKCIDWLKSINPKHWKPSEQNIKDLEWCADLVKDKMGVGFHRIQVFIDDLRKAMEE